MNARATLANAAWLASSLPAATRFSRALAQPRRAQQLLLRQFLRRHERCTYGRLYRFPGIRNYQDFASRVPLTDYDHMASWVARIQAGESNLLHTGRVTHLVPTSGSSGSRKLIPFSASLQQGFNAALGPWMVDLCRTDPGLVLGPAFWSVTPLGSAASPLGSRVPVGFDDDAAYLGGLRSWLVNAAMAVPSSLRTITDVSSFRRAALLLLLRARDLRLISVWHPSFLTLLLAAMAEEWAGLLKAVRDGDGVRAATMPPAVSTALVGRPNPQRARELERLGPDRWQALWPALRIVSCWGDGHAAPALAQLAQRLPGVKVQAKGLLATEGVMTIPYSGHYPVAVTSHFFEFLRDDGDIFPVEELVQGNQYEMVITNGGGLWRYRMGDRVEVTGFLGATPSLRFLGRSQLFSDHCGEKLSESFVGAALASCWASPSDRPRFALLAPERISDRIHYTLFIDGPSVPELARRLDDQLRENPQYAYCRQLGQLGMPRVFQIAGDGYRAFVAAETHRGMRLGDIKPICLSPRTDWSRHFPEASSPSEVPARD